jgi:uncharacterized protein (TIGR03546 family)
MTLILKQIFDFLRLLNSETGTRPIAWGVVCGMILGFTPAFSIQTLLVIVLLFFFRIQIGAAMVSAVLFKSLSFFLDGVFDPAGRAVLELSVLQGLFTTLFNMPLVPLTRFNNSIVMGSAVVALALVIPMYLISKTLIAQYREQVVARIRATKLFRALQSTKFYSWYVKYEQLRRSA